jgi:hypothetical protein
MTTKALLTEEQLVQRATQVLIANLGLVEATRFLALTSRGRVESVERHRTWQETLEKDEFFDQVFSDIRRA